MKKSLCFQAGRICLLLLISLLFPVLLRADSEFMGVDELKPGMKGIGKTVFSGTKVEDFPVEIIGVLKNVWPKADMILIRLGGDFLERTGVIAGMSGSPIYIEGKLIGALAYGWSFSKDPIAGVTPIKEMLSVWDSDKSDEDIKRRESSSSWNQPVTVRSEWGDITMRPLPSPLILSGFDPRVVKEMEPELNRLGFMVTQGGGGGSVKEEENAPLVPGSAMGVSLVQGDFNVAGIGTLTYRRGDKILAFGHPMLLGGTTDLPLTGAYIYTVFPSQYVSFKLGSATRTVGRINQDRGAAIAGEVGSFARMVPFKIKVRGNGKEEDYKFKIINNKFYLPTYLWWVTANSIVATERMIGQSRLDFSLVFSLKGREEPVTLEYTYSDLSSPLMGIYQLRKPFKQIVNNPFREVEIEGVSLEVDVREAWERAAISGVRLSKNKVKPGDSVEVTVMLKPFKGDSTLRTVKLMVPEDAPEGKATIIVSDALAARKQEKKRAPYKFQPKNFDQLIKLMEDQDKNTEVIIRMVLPRGGAVVSGEELPALPGSVLAVMGASLEAGLGGITKTDNLVVRKLSTDWVISPGSYSISLMVKNKLGGRR